MKIFKEILSLGKALYLVSLEERKIKKEIEKDGLEHFLQKQKKLKLS